MLYQAPFQIICVPYVYTIIFLTFQCLDIVHILLHVRG